MQLDDLDGLVLAARSDRKLDVWCTHCGRFVVEERHSGIELRRLLDDALDHRCGG